jgi:ACT domain-containing protein
MAEHRDASVSDVTIVIDARYGDKINAVVDDLKKMGVQVSEMDNDQGVIEGTVETFKVAEIQKLDSVDYVRVDFTYIADYPTGDPRDLDKEPT